MEKSESGESAKTRKGRKRETSMGRKWLKRRRWPGIGNQKKIKKKYFE